jgi:hypothetical protein
MRYHALGSSSRGLIGSPSQKQELAGNPIAVVGTYLAPTKGTSTGPDRFLQLLSKEKETQGPSLRVLRHPANSLRIKIPPSKSL